VRPTDGGVQTPSSATERFKVSTVEAIGGLDLQVKENRKPGPNYDCFWNRNLKGVHTGHNELVS